MSFKRGLLDNIIRKWNKKLRYRSMAWLLIVCLCVVNLNSLAFAVEDGTQASGGATPSAASASEVMMPEEAAYGNELLEEAERAITNGAKFDFDSVIRLSETGDEDEDSNLELYKNLFDGYESFTLFYDNDHDGKIIGSRNDVYGYIVVRLTKKEYLDYLEMASPSETSESETDENGGYHLSGNEDLIFLYVNGSNVDATFNINLADMETSEIVIPSLYSFEEEETEDIALTEEIVEEINVDNSAAPGAGGSGSSGVASDDNSTEEIVNGEPEDNQEESEEKTENDTEQEAGEEATEEGKKDSEIEDTDQSDDTEGITTSDDNQSSGDEAENENSDAEEKSEENDSEENADSNQKETVDSDKNNESEEEEKASEEKADSDNQTDNDTEKGSDREDKSEDTSSDSFKETEVTIVGKTVPRVMGPNPDATGEEDDDDMSFEEWQEMMEELEEEEETDEEDDYESSSYEEDDGTRYLNLFLLPVVTASVRRPQPTQPSALFRRARSVVQEEPVTLGASVVPTSAVTDNSATNYYKQIEAKEDGNYRLHLGVSGKNPALDILLIIDNSSSMYTGDYHESEENSLMKELKNALTKGDAQDKSFIDNVLERSNLSRFSVIKYATKATKVLDWNSNATTIKNSINNISAPNYWYGQGGTNYEDGLYEARELLKNRTGDNIPVVIFLSDGEPSVYNRGSRENDGDYTFNGSKVGTGSSESYISGETINAAKEFNKDSNVIGSIVYAVKFGTAGATYLRYVAYGESATTMTEYSRVISGSSLDDSFKTLFESLEFKNVQIEDTLSQYVDLTGTTLEDSNAEVYKIVNGEKNKLNKGTDYESLEYDSSSKKVSLKFGSDKVLDTNAIYELAFDIKANQVATDYYEANNVFPDVGEKNTDYGDGTISSGQPGFFSNEEAKLKFGIDNEVILPKPVVKVKEKAYEPPHRKYIKANDDGTYTLTLDVKSQRSSSSSTTTEKIPADIMFVIDRSGSMQWYMNNQTETGSNNWEQSRAYAANNAISKVLELGNGQYNVKFGGYKFNKTTSEDFYGWYETKDEANNLLLTYSDCQGGTRPADALKKAIAKLKSEGRSDAKKYLIFLTDGKPDGESYDTSYDAVKGIQIPGLKFYAVRVTSNAGDSYMKQLVSTINNDTTKAAGVTAQKLNGNTTSELESSLEEIKNDILSSITENEYGVKNVTITDNLSEYVDLLSLENEITVKKVSSDRTETELDNSLYTVSISENKKQIVIDFVDSYELERDVVYSVSFNVKPSEQAMNEYLSNSLVDPEKPYGEVKGDLNTDAPGNVTSSEQPGFHSNSSAFLTYTSESDGLVYYDHPVIQVPTSTLTISKTVSGAHVPTNSVYHFSVKFGNGKQVQAPDKAKWIDEKYTFDLTADEQIVFGNIPVGMSYTVEETGNTVDTEKYTLSSITSSLDGESTSSLREGTISKTTHRGSGTIRKSGSTAAFTNVFAQYGYITITKILDGDKDAYPAADPDGNRIFTFTLTPPEGTKLTGTYNPVSVEVGPSGTGEATVKIEPEDVKVDFTISEVDPQGAWFTHVNAGTNDETEATVSAEDGPVTFTNYYYKHSITIKKLVETTPNPMPNADYTFDIFLNAPERNSDFEIALSSGNSLTVQKLETPEDGYTHKAIVTVKAGEENALTLNNLPKEVIGYKVSEDVTESSKAVGEDYNVELVKVIHGSTNEEDKIASGELKTDESKDVVIEFTNRIVRAKGRLRIVKKLKDGDSNYVPNEEVTFRFKVTRTLDDGSQEFFYVPVRVAGSNEGDSRRLEGEHLVDLEVPTGTYSVEELPTLRFKVIGSAIQKDVVVKDNELTTVMYENSKNDGGYLSDSSTTVNEATETGGFVPKAKTKQSVSIAKYLLPKKQSEELTSDED